MNIVENYLQIVSSSMLSVFDENEFDYVDDLLIDYELVINV